MRTRTYAEMLEEYGQHIEEEDIRERKEKLKENPFSVIVELDFLELDNLENWIRMNCGEESFLTIFYGKTGYDFGFSEYFFKQQSAMELTKKIIPLIYTTFPKLRARTNGYGIWEEYSMDNPNTFLL